MAKNTSYRRQRKTRMLELVAMVVGLLLIISLSIWAWVDAPCWVYKFEAGARIPGRCLMDQEQIRR